MKNQYFGDISDYRKYGLLRVISKTFAVKIGVGWMLTEDDGRTDGKFVDYFSSPDKWRNYDPEIFDAMKTQVANGNRNVELAENGNYIPNAIYFSDYLTDDIHQREMYIQQMLDAFRETDLIFLDPDNGLEVKSVKKGNKNSNKFVYWDELETIANHVPSILLYQHFRRVQRDIFIETISKDLLSRLSAQGVMYFRTAHVVFFLVTKSPEIVRQFEALSENMSAQWGDQFQVGVYT